VGTPSSSDSDRPVDSGAGGSLPRGEPSGEERDTDPAGPNHIKPPESIPPISAEDLVDGERPEGGGAGGAGGVGGVGGTGGEVPEVRQYPSTIGGLFYLIMLAVALVGLGIAASGSWLLGMLVLGGSLVVGAIVRLFLNPYNAGMLAVRNKAFDAGALLLLGAAIITLALLVPDQPGL